MEYLLWIFAYISLFVILFWLQVLLAKTAQQPIKQATQPKASIIIPAYNEEKTILKVIDKVKNKNTIYLDGRVIYTLVLRIRTLHIIRNLIENNRYSKEDFVRLIKNIFFLIYLLIYFN